MKTCVSEKIGTHCVPLRILEPLVIGTNHKIIKPTIPDPQMSVWQNSNEEIKFEHTKICKLSIWSQVSCLQPKWKVGVVNL